MRVESPDEVSVSSTKFLDRARARESEDCVPVIAAITHLPNAVGCTGKYYFSVKSRSRTSESAGSRLVAASGKTSSRALLEGV